MNDHGHGPPSVAPEKVKLIIGFLFTICAISVGAELLSSFHPHEHAGLEFVNTFGFHAWYGFLSCVLLVLAAAQMRKLVMRDEDYYDRD